MKLRTRLIVVMTGLGATFMAALLAAEVESSRVSVREEIEAANIVASQFLSRIAAAYADQGGPERVRAFLQQLGRVRANEVYLRGADGIELYRSPPASYKAGRSAPAWFARVLTPDPVRHIYPLSGTVELVIEAQPSRAVLDAWDDIAWLSLVGLVALATVSAVAFWTVERALKPFPVIARGLRSIEQGDLTARLPQFPGEEARAMGAAFNRMAEAVQGKTRAEREARDAEARLENRRELAALTEQRVEEERRLIAHELHDEFGQSVTAIRSLAVAITQQADQPGAAVEMAQLISDEAARLYDAMHGLIPRLAPLSLDTLGLAATLDGLVRDWQRRRPGIAIALEHDLPAELGSRVSLCIYRVVQEGLINALRHANPAHIGVRVTHAHSRIQATVEDDGAGLPADWERPGHFGLRGLADRVQQLGGRFDVAPAAPSGTRLSADIPLEAAA
jgi:two-component system, NarL family, sensor histidine kinase UhpB